MGQVAGLIVQFTKGVLRMNALFCLRQSIYLYMKIYLYDEITNEYIGELSTFANRPNLPVDTMLIYNKVKYLIVASEQLEGTNNYTATVKKA